MTTTEDRRRYLAAGLMSGVVLGAAIVLNLPRSQSCSPTFPTNVVFQLSQIQWQPAQPESVRVSWEGIEPAERINEMMLRRHQQEWRRAGVLGFPQPPTLPGNL